MLKLFVAETELIPVDLGMQKINKRENESEKLYVKFRSEKSLTEVQELFNSLSETDVIRTLNEKNELAYTGFTSMSDEVSIKVNADGTYDYRVCMEKKSAYDIAQQNKADIEYIALVSGVEI